MLINHSDAREEVNTHMHAYIYTSNDEAHYYYVEIDRHRQ